MTPISMRSFVLERGLKEASDTRFDVILPIEWRECSARYWTPVDVAVRAAQWFAEAGTGPVLDVGSGVGKMCVIGALTSKLEFVGVEQREPLVRASRQVAELLGLSDRATFIHTSIDAFDASAFRAFYLFNPFGENLYSASECLDTSVELSVNRYSSDVRVVERILRDAPIGSRVITYHGFGGRMPNSYAPERVQCIGSDALRLWVKRRARANGHYIEMGSDDVCVGRDLDDDAASSR